MTTEEFFLTIFETYHIYLMNIAKLCARSIDLLTVLSIYAAQHMKKKKFHFRNIKHTWHVYIES